MATLDLFGSALGNALGQIMEGNDIQPGDEPSYQLCKTVYAYHPLGAKIVDFPIQMAQFAPRKITVPEGPEEELAKAFIEEWEKCASDRHILNVCRQARIYGVSSIALVGNGIDPTTEADFAALASKQIAFNVFDPLNTAGSLILNQDPDAPDFQKVTGIAVKGKAYHRSRTVVLMNEDPLYIEYTNSAFGYVGRSIYQRGLFPLKSFINTQRTNDLIATKAGIIVAMIKQVSSAIDKVARGFAAQKRNLIQEARTGNVLQIGHEDKIESLNLQNLDGAANAARRNILEDIASSTGTPAKIILAESFAEGFGEGSEDAKHIAQFIDRLREWMKPVYDFFDKIVMHRAWSPEFYATIQAKYPKYKDLPYNTAFREWSNSFIATWPSLLEEPDSEKVKVSETRFKAVVDTFEMLEPVLDPENKATLVTWVTEIVNSEEMLFSSPLILDMDKLSSYLATLPSPADTFDAEREDASNANDQATAALASKPPPAPKPKPKGTGA